MALRALLVLFLLLTLFGAGFFLLVEGTPEYDPALAFPTEPGPHGQEADEGAAPVPVPPPSPSPEQPSPQVLDLIVLLEGLLADEGEEATGKLAGLALRDDLVGYLARLSLAQRSLAAGGSPADHYRRALALYTTEEVRFELAAWLAQDGQREEAISEYLLLLPVREAMDALRELDAPPLIVCRALVQGSHWQTAVEYISSTIDNQGLSTAARLELAATLGESHARLGNQAQGLPFLKEAYAGGYGEAAWWYARSLESGGAKVEAASLYAGLGAAGAYRLGLILIEQGKQEEAALALERSDNPAALWQGARLWEELGRPEKAVGLYRELARGNSNYRDDGAYRAFILMQRQGLPGKGEMEEILLEYPAWAARLAGEARWQIAEMDADDVPAFIRRVDALRESGRREWAEIELAIGQERADLNHMLALGIWYLEQGNYFRATRWGIRSLNAQKTRPGYLLAYQRPFAPMVLQAAEKYDLEPHLIWAVMREESHFRPEAVSRVGAMGLMQVMPTTGREIARNKGFNLGAFDLLKPEVSIDFGAYYLRRMLDDFAGDVDKALAAYNGGAGNVRRWSRSPLGTTAEDFPSVITFLETREYVTKVLNSYHTYNHLYGRQHGRQEAS